MSPKDPWHNLRQFTDARIGLGRSGSAMPTREVLEFAFAHAMARDAVTSALDWGEIEKSILALGLKTLQVESAAAERGTYLRRPDLGRQLSPASRQALVHAAENLKAKPDIAIVVGDGLSSKAVSANIAPFLAVVDPHLKKHNWNVGPVVLAHNARVALGDEVGELLAAKAVIVLIGERPGLSSPDSLGAYLTWAPRAGLKDADVPTWFGFFGPAGLPKDIVGKMNSKMVEFAKDPAFAKKLWTVNAILHAQTPEDFVKLLASDSKTNLGFIQAANIKLE